MRRSSPRSQAPGPGSAPPATQAVPAGASPSAAGTYRQQTEARVRAFFRNPLGLVLTLFLAFVVLGFPFLDRWFDWKRITDAIPILMYVLLGLGLNVVVGFAGLLDLGYAAFFAIGAYTAAILTSAESPINNGTLQWYSNFWLAVPAAFLV